MQRHSAPGFAKQQHTQQQQRNNKEALKGEQMALQ